MYFDYWIKKKVRSDTMLGGPKKLQTMKMLSLGHQLMFFSSCCSWPSSSFCLILLSVHLFRCLVMLIHSVANPWTIDCSGSSLKWDSPGKNTGVGCHFLLSPRDRTQVCFSCVAGVFFTAESSRKKTSSHLYFVWSLPIPSLLPSHQHRILLT